MSITIVEVVIVYTVKTAAKNREIQYSTPDLHKQAGKAVGVIQAGGYYPTGVTPSPSVEQTLGVSSQPTITQSQTTGGE